MSSAQCSFINEEEKTGEAWGTHFYMIKIIEMCKRECNCLQGELRGENKTKGFLHYSLVVQDWNSHNQKFEVSWDNDTKVERGVKIPLKISWTDWIYPAFFNGGDGPWIPFHQGQGLSSKLCLSWLIILISFNFLFVQWVSNGYCKLSTHLERNRWTVYLIDLFLLMQCSTIGRPWILEHTL